ncbi:MAG: ABC transporter permease, partial [Gemmatimonadetes bacterium]|nr:ABC transporter permease [Gemmatimonadota bacterium]
MARFLARRFLFALLTLLAATMIVFTVSRLTGDPRAIYARPQGYGISPEYYEALGRKLGLDKPLIVQYFIWLGRALKGDLGNTLFTERPVIQLLKEKSGATVQLALSAWLFATVVGVPTGVLSATNRGGIWDYIGRAFALFGQAAPQFWLGIMFILLFAVKLDLLPSGTKGGLGVPLSGQLKYFVLPTIVMGWAAAAGYLRLTRSAMLEVL